MRYLIYSIIAVLTCNTLAQDHLTEVYVGIHDLDSLYAPYSGSFVLFDINAGNSYKVYNDSLSCERFSPCSTFKIANSLIGIESEVAENEDYLISWDSLKNPPQPWWHNTEPFNHWMEDHNMQSAIKYSVVWYYQELARRIGEESMAEFLGKIDYGNNDISSGIDRFWLCGSLKISAWEQVEFLTKLYTHKLSGFSDETLETVKKIMFYEKTDSYTLYGKTGGGNCSANQVIGWYVGFVETKTGPYVFAMNLLADDFSAFDNNKRIELTREILKSLNIIE